MFGIVDPELPFQILLLLAKCINVALEQSLCSNETEIPVVMLLSQARNENRNTEKCDVHLILFDYTVHSAS